MCDTFVHETKAWNNPNQRQSCSMKEWPEQICWCILEYHLVMVTMTQTEASIVHRPQKMASMNEEFGVLLSNLCVFKAFIEFFADCKRD